MTSEKYLKLGVAVAIVVLVLIVSNRWYTREERAFCSELSRGESVDQVHRKAVSRGYWVYNRESISGLVEVWVSTRDSPYFRYACVATFRNNQLIEMAVRVDD
jgi:hypothetical protein